jgi:hypothetical protein
MPGIALLNEVSDSFKLDFAEREATLEPAMNLDIRLHLGEISISYTVSILDRICVGLLSGFPGSRCGQ